MGRSLLPVLAHGLGQLGEHACLEVLLARQVLRSGTLGIVSWWSRPGSRLVERHAHDEHGAAVLRGCDAPGREAAAVAHALDAVDDGPRQVAGLQEVGVQRMGDAFGRHRAHGCNQGLAERLAAEHPLPGLLRAAAAKQVILQRLQVQNGAKVLDGAGRLGPLGCMVRLTRWWRRRQGRPCRRIVKQAGRGKDEHNAAS